MESMRTSFFDFAYDNDVSRQAVMDPLSPVASVLAIATAAGQIAKAISRLRAFGKMPDRVYALKNEVTDLEVVLRQVGWVLENNASGTTEDPAALKRTLARTKGILTELATALENLATLCAKSKIKVITRSTVWLRQKEIFDKFQYDIQTIKADFNVVLGVSNSSDLQHIILELRRVSIMTSTNVTSHEAHSKSITQALADQQNAIYTMMDQQYRSLSTRIDMLAQAETIRKPPDEELGESPGTDVEAVRVSITHRIPCRSWCPCACHSKKKVKLSLPGVMENLVGKMFVGYTGLPVLNKTCDFRGCNDKQDLSVTMEYWFPGWFFSRNLRLSLRELPNSGPQLQLTTTRRVPDAAQSIIFATAGNIEGLKGLFTQGLACPRDISDSRGYSLIRWALYGGMHQYETVQFLIAQGASVDDISYENVWDFVFRNKCSHTEAQALRCITEGGDGDWLAEQNFPLIHRIVFGMASKSLRAELDENPYALYATDAQNRTALDWATARAQLDDIQLLISYGADINNMDVTGRTPVLHAVDSHSIPTMRLVLEAGGNPNPVYPKGLYRSAPITAAGRANMVDMLKLLLQFDADPDACNPEGVTALDNVAQTSSAACAILLLEYGADLNAISRHNTTPFTSAIVHNNHEVLKIFVERCYEDIMTTRLKGPQLLPIIAGCADVETMSILASSKPLKWSYDLSLPSIAANIIILENRRDYDEKLASAFEDLVTIAQAEESRSASVDSLVESGFFTARSSFHSELMDAMSTLHSATVSIHSEDEPTEDEADEPLVQVRRASTV